MNNVVDFKRKYKRIQETKNRSILPTIDSFYYAGIWCEM